MWLTRTEQVTLAWLAVAGVIGLGVMWWQQRRPPLSIEPAHSAQWDAALARTRRIDVNTANAAELEQLPGIGPARAQQILAYRAAHGRFTTPEALRQVPGVSKTVYEQLQGDITVQSEAARVP